MDRTDNTLKILAAVSSLLFLLIAIKTSYPAESIGDMTVNIAGKFVTYELILFSAIYVAGPMISESMPGIWEETRKFLRKQHSYHVTETDTPIITSSRLLLPAHIISEDTVHNQEAAISIDTEDEDAGIVAMEDEVSDEIIEYTYKTFENILTTEQIEKIFSNLRKFNNGEKFEAIEKEALPDYIYQFDILHFVWNVSKRIYNKRQSKYKFRDRAAEFAKSSFPLTVTSALGSIGPTMSDENRTCSLPIILPGKPLIPHNFDDVKNRKEKKKQSIPS